MCRVIAVSNQKGGVGTTVSCVNLGIGLAQEGKMTCGKSIPPQMLPTDIIRVDFPKLCEESVLEEGVLDEDTAD